jgi:hypothetical protein
MLIDYKGEKQMAYNLIMRKVHAKDIVSGKKRVEIRQFSDYFIGMFFDREKDAFNQKNPPEKWVNPVRDDVDFIHFRDYDNSWFLDVKIGNCGIGMIEQETIEYLAKNYDFHDLDNEWQQYKDDDEPPLFFWFEIKEIVDNNLV